jgi:hypothetical protein
MDDSYLTGPSKIVLSAPSIRTLTRVSIFCEAQNKTRTLANEKMEMSIVGSLEFMMAFKYHPDDRIYGIVKSARDDQS